MEAILIKLLAAYFFYLCSLLAYMLYKRTQALKSGAVRMSYYRTYQGEGSEELRAIKNHIDNQFQMPLLFFVVGLLQIQLQSVSPLTIFLASVFFISRVMHSFVHLGGNNVMQRFLFYFIGVLALLAMWIQVFIMS